LEDLKRIKAAVNESIRFLQLKEIWLDLDMNLGASS